jgi:hypothetical protein
MVDCAAEEQTMPTLKITELDFNWPDIFITGNVPADASDDLLGAYALRAWGNAYAGAAIPPRFGDVMRQIAHRLNVSGTPQSFLDWGDRRTEASK